MRIIAGKLRGLKLSAPHGYDVRPTADRVKESVFAILGERLVEAKVLDLFCGSGNLTIESYSRGAKQLVCVDSDPVSLKATSANMEKARILEQVKIYRKDALKSITLFFRQGELFDIIFCDPPYNRGFVQKVLEQIKKYNVLVKGGIIVIEYSQHENFSLPEGFTTLRSESYGETVVAFIGLGE